MNISTISNWNQYIGDNTSQNYILSSNLRFTSISGTINLQAGRTFDGQNNTIYLNDISNFNGLFNLHAGNTTTNIKNLQIICSNVSISNFNGVLVRGSGDNSIVSNGNIDNVHIIYRNSSFGNLCGGIIGCSSKNISITNCHVDIGRQNIMTSNSGGGLIGGNAGVIGTISLENSFFKGSLSNNTGGLVGDNSIISSMRSCYIIGTASNNNEISLGNTTISSSFNVRSTGTKNKLANNTDNLSDVVNLTDSLNLPPNRVYQINGGNVLSATTLGSSVNSSSFRTLGILDTVTVQQGSTLGNVQSDLVTTTGSLSNGNNIFDFGNIIGSGNIIVNASIRITPNINSNNKKELVINHINSNINLITQNAMSNTKLDHTMITMGNVAGNGIVSIFTSNMGVMKDVVDITSSNITIDNRQYINYTTYTKYPEYPMNADSVNGYTVTTSSNYTFGGSSSNRYFLFNGVTTGLPNTTWTSDYNNMYSIQGIYQGAKSTTFMNLSGLPDAYYGEWIQLQLPVQQAFEYIKIFGRVDDSLVLYRAPRNFIILGSNDGTVWNEIQRYSNYVNWVVVSPNLGKSFPLNNKTPYLYYRVIINRVGTSESNILQGYLDLAEIEFYTTTTTKISTPVIEEYPRFLNFGEPVQYISKTEQKSLFGSDYIYKSSSCSATDSLIYGNTVPYFAFDGADSVTVFNSSATFSSGNPTGSTPLTYNVTGYGSYYTGEWLQLTIPDQICLTHYTIVAANTTLAPKDWVMVGSNDENTWFLLDTETGVTMTSSAQNNYYCPNSTYNSMTFRHFRLCVNKVLSGTSLQVASLKVNGFRPIGTGSIQLLTNTLNLGYTDYLYNKAELWCVKKSGNPFTSPSNNLYSIFDGSGDIIHNQFTGNPLLYGWRFDKLNNMPGGAFFVNTPGLYNIQLFIKMHSAETVTTAGISIKYGKNINNCSFVGMPDSTLWINSNVNGKESMCYSDLIYLNQGDGIWLSMYGNSYRIAQVRFSGYLVSV